MKILIPMAGKSQRFIDAGYTVPKHLILVEGIPVIEHIVRKFSTSDDFVFGCSEDELHQISLLKRIAPKCNIVSMPFKKEGPLYGLKIMQNFIQDEEAVVVNYCDFSWVWDYEDFKSKISENNCDGAIVSYRGFHPHLLGNDKYATLDADGLWVREVKEKYSWHKSKMDDWTSSGTYYFRKGAYIKKYIKEIERSPELKINSEFYVSQLFQLMKEDGLKIFLYEIPYMLQWGTPEDLEEYLFWSDYFKLKVKSARSNFRCDMNILMLMAGEGKRFLDAGGFLPKPFINIDGNPMFLCASRALPRGNKYIFVARSEHLEKYNVYDIAQEEFKNLEIIKTDKVTEGQASTALLAEKLINNDVPLLLGACDSEITYDIQRFKKLTSDSSDIDALIFTFRNNPIVRRNPWQYGWVRANAEGRALNVSAKNPLSNNPVLDHAIVGSFWFKKGNYYVENAKQMIKANDRVNNEFYIDTCMNYLIKNNLNVYVFEVDKYISWGTPDDIKTYEYWQTYFSKYSGIKSPGEVSLR